MFRPVTDKALQIETVLFAKEELMRGVLHDFVLFLASRLQGVKSQEVRSTDE
jgi:hypothetical protein